MKKFLILIAIVFNLKAINFALIDSFRDGTGGGANIKGADIDEDGLTELIFSYGKNIRDKIVIYEKNDGPGFSLKHVVPLYPDSTWWTERWFSIGDFDNDGKTDIFQATHNLNNYVEYFEIIESKTPGAYPDTLVWIDSIDFYMGGNSYIPESYPVDYDRDGLTNIFVNKGEGYATIFAFENTEDNQYRRSLYERIGDRWNTCAIGDVDGDSFPEIALLPGNIVEFWESAGDDPVQIVGKVYLPSGELRAYSDNIYCGDVNNNGKPEVMIHAHTPQPYSGTWRDDIWLIEAVGNNQYEIIWYDSIPDNPCYPHYEAISSAGDVTGDGIPEIILSMNTRVYVIQYIPGQGYTYIWQKYFPSTTESINTTVYDVNNNGLNDIVLSVCQTYTQATTYIYEMSPSVSEKYLKISPYFYVFPNITSDSIRIFYSLKTKKPADFCIYNILGEKIYFKQLKPEGKLYLSLKNLKLKPGVYFLKLKSENFKKTDKVIFLRR